MFGTRVLVNGQLVGEHLPCFTPAEFDVRKYLDGSGGANELVVRVGAHRDVLPKGMPDGFDYEKFDYIPGIYDSVELIFCARPRVVNLQAVPDLEAQAVRVAAEIEGPGGKGEAELTCRVREVSTGKEVGSAQAACPASEEVKTVQLRVLIQGPRLWSPEDPFLSPDSCMLRSAATSRRGGCGPSTGR